MHEQILNGRPGASTEAGPPGDCPASVPAPSSTPGCLAKAFPPQEDEEALAHCPAVIADLVTGVTDACPASAPCVTAVALAIAAAAAGPKVRLARGINRPAEPVAFNLIVIHRAPRTLPWFDLVGAPFIGRVLDMQIAFTREGAASIRKEITQRKTDLKNASRTIHPNPELIAQVKAELDRSGARLKPFVATSRLTLRELAQFLPQSFDGGMLSVALGSDPGDELLRLKSPERSTLAELLNRSWARIPLSMGSDTYDALLSILWQTRRAPSELLGSGGFDSAAFLPVPMLLLEEIHVPGSGPMPVLPAEPIWKRMIDFLFDTRCQEAEVRYTLDGEAEAALEEFRALLDEELPSVPLPCRSHLVWLPDLAARLAVLFSILQGESTTSVAGSVAADAVAVTQWIGRQHLRVITSALPAADATAPVDKSDRPAVMLAKIRAKGPLRRRELWQSYDNARISWFGPTLESLLSSGRVRYNDRKQLEVCE